MPDLKLLLEAERRGILPPDKKSLLDEAKRRGLVRWRRFTAADAGWRTSRRREAGPVRRQGRRFGAGAGRVEPTRQRVAARQGRGHAPIHSPDPDGPGDRKPCNAGAVQKIIPGEQSQ